LIPEKHVLHYVPFPTRRTFIVKRGVQVIEIDVMNSFE
jgi:hypothetical protein